MGNKRRAALKEQLVATTTSRVTKLRNYIEILLTLRLFNYKFWKQATRSLEGTTCCDDNKSGDKIKKYIEILLTLRLFNYKFGKQATRNFEGKDRQAFKLVGPNFI